MLGFVNGCPDWIMSSFYQLRKCGLVTCLTVKLLIYCLCRMFVDALDTQMYDEHHSTGRCPLSLSKVTCFVK